MKVLDSRDEHHATQADCAYAKLPLETLFARLGGLVDRLARLVPQPLGKEERGSVSRLVVRYAPVGILSTLHLRGKLWCSFMTA
jgi:hypothetical protein